MYIGADITRPKRLEPFQYLGPEAYTIYEPSNKRLWKGWTAV